MNIKAGTIARTIILVIALVNQVLAVLGYGLIPIENEQINELVTLACTISTSLIAWWKNNSFSKNAIKADDYLKELKG